MKKVALISFLLGAVSAGSAVYFLRPISASAPQPPTAIIEPAHCPALPVAITPVCPSPPPCTVADANNTDFVPQLPAPVLRSDVPAELVTNYEGEVRLRWRAVVGAKNYVIVIEDRTGKAVRRYKPTSTSMYLKDIPMPTGSEREKYVVRLATANALGVIGPFSEPRSLVVKKPLNLVAPAIKEIRVED